MSSLDRINSATVAPLLPMAPPQRPAGPTRTVDGRSFEEVLRTKVHGAALGDRPLALVPDLPAAPASTLKFSAHAMARLNQRGIQLTPEQGVRLESAVDRAGAKGARDALVLLDDTAMVVSVQNRTVITALGTHQARENVFTNIDSAVIA